MTDQEISELAAKVLSKAVPAACFQGADVKSETDFDGDPIIRITARYGESPARRDALIETVHALRSALIERGEERFVVLANDVLPERQDESDLD